MNVTSQPLCRQLTGSVQTNIAVSSGLLRLDIKLDETFNFLPGQFAMLNVTSPAPLVFSRPFSILAADGDVVSFVYRVIGRGTRMLADLANGSAVTVLGPLGKTFPAPTSEKPVLLIAGGVGLPPLVAWWNKYSRNQDQAFFGGRDGADIPWSELPDRWQVSVDQHTEIPSGKTAWHGLVTELVANKYDLASASGGQILSCGPLPLLKAVAGLASNPGWSCLVSMEEHMGCGYGACKGCVIPVFNENSTPGAQAVRNATCCQEGPVFKAENIDWKGLA